MANVHQKVVDHQATKKETLGVLQHVKNVDMMLECAECGGFNTNRDKIQETLGEWEFTCKAQL